MLFPPDGAAFASFGRKGSRIWIWEDLYRSLIEACPPEKVRVQIDPPDHWLLVRLLVARLREEGEDELPPGTAAPGFVEMAGDTLRELLREDVPREELTASLGCSGCSPEGGCTRLFEESGILCRLYGDYLALLEKEGLADSAQLPSLGTEQIRKDPGQAVPWARQLRLCAVGFLSFTSSQLHFLSALTSSGAVLSFWIPRCGEGDFYTALQQFPEGVVTDFGSKEPGAALSLAAGDRRLSTDTLARELFFWSAGEGFLSRAGDRPFPGWSAVTVCGDAPDIESVMESFSRYGLPFSLKEGMAVADSLLWKAALRARDLAFEGWPARETADFLSGLLFAPVTFPRREFALRLPSGREQWLRFLRNFSPSSGLEGFERALRFTDALSKGGRPEELLAALKALAPGREELKELLKGAEDAPVLDGEIRKLTLTIMETEQKETFLRDLRRDLGEAGRTHLSSEDSMAFLARWAESNRTWIPPATEPSVALYPGTPPVLFSSPVWIFAGVTAKSWPGQVRESPLLSDEKKEALHASPLLGLGRSHLPLVSEKRSQREALFRRLTACAEGVCIFLRPLSDESGRTIAPSPFLEAAVRPPRPWLLPLDGKTLERSLGEILPGPEEPLAGGVEISSLPSFPMGYFRGNPASIPLPVPEQTFSLSGLDDFDSCPFMYYMTHLRGLESPREELYRSDLAGIALHTLWERAWGERLASGRPLPELVRELFPQVLSSAYARLNADPRLGRTKNDLLEKALRLAILQEEMERRGLGETRGEQLREFSLPDCRIGDLTFRGRCDRMEVLTDGRVVLFDYKGGQSSRFTKSLQLAAYGLTLKEERAAAVYLCLGDGRESGALRGEKLPWLAVRGDLSALEDRAREVMEQAARSFATGLFPPRYDSPSCRWCTCSTLCRRLEGRGRDDEREDERDDGDE